MALLDVSELMTDPDFVDQTISIVRTAITVGANGRATESITNHPGIRASVQPASGQQLRLLPDAAQQNGAIQIFTTFILQPTAPGYNADQVLWEGNTYTVENLSRYTNWGSGFVRAVCALKSLVDGQ